MSEKLEFYFALREDLKHDKRFLPTRATEKSAGWDVSCAFTDQCSHIINPGEYFKIPLGFRCVPAEGYWLEMKPRSSTFIKKKIHALYGTIDPDFFLEMHFLGKYDGDVPLTLDFGEKIGQLIPVKMRELSVNEINNEEFEKLSEKYKTNRVGGFGSSSK